MSKVKMHTTISPFESLYSNLYRENTEHKIRVQIFMISRIAREMQKEPMVEKFFILFLHRPS